MEDKVYRQRRNLMITCIGIILFYMGPGNFNEIGLLKNLGLHTLDEWQLKGLVLVMYLYYAWRYYQYCNEYPTPFIKTVESYTENNFGLIDSNIRSLLTDKITNAKASSPALIVQHDWLINDVHIESLLGVWHFAYQGQFNSIIGDDEFEGPYRSPLTVNLMGIEWLHLKLFISFMAGFKHTGFTDWIIPWLIFWGTFILIMWHEVAIPAWQLATL